MKTKITTEPEIDLREYLAQRGQIAVVWCVTDVKEMRPDLTDEQSWEVLEHVRDNHDCDLGIT